MIPSVESIAKVQDVLTPFESTQNVKPIVSPAVYDFALLMVVLVEPTVTLPILLMLALAGSRPRTEVSAFKVFIEYFLKAWSSLLSIKRLKFFLMMRK